MAGEITPEEQKLLSGFIESRRKQIIEAQGSKGLKASGNSAKMLHANLVGSIAQLVDGSGYFEFQEYGRKAGGAPPFQKLYEWLAFKKYGIEYKDDKQRRSIAWALQKKIRDKGTYTSIRNQPTGVITDALNRAALNELLGQITRTRANKVSTDIKRLMVSR